MDENTIIPSAPLSGIVREGWLMKMGRGKKSWKRRWFVLVAYDSGGCTAVNLHEGEEEGDKRRRNLALVDLIVVR